MANKVNLGCNQTRGTFQIIGKVTGRLSQNFCVEGTSSNGKLYRRVHFGVEYDAGKTIYLDMFGMVQDSCYISKRITVGNNTKVDTQTIPWSKRFDFAKDPNYKDYRIIGVTCGCTKMLDSKGVERNNVKYLTNFDACDEVLNLQDGQSVFVRGNIEYSTYEDKHRVNFAPTQISLRQPVDFDALDFEPVAYFTQPLVLMGVEANKETEEYDVSAKIVNYSTVEDAEFHISKDMNKMANALKKLGSYVYLEASGDIVMDGEVVEEKVDDMWGRANRMKRVASPFVRKLMIAGVDGDTIDKETYSEAVIEHAMEVAASIKSAKDDYGAKDDDAWVKTKKSNFDEEEDDDFDLNI